MGHSFGGAFMQLLLGASLDAAGVSIDGAAVTSVQALPFSAIKATFPVLKNLANRDRAVPCRAVPCRSPSGNPTTRSRTI